MGCMGFPGNSLSCSKATPTDIFELIPSVFSLHSQTVRLSFLEVLWLEKIHGNPLIFERGSCEVAHSEV